MDVKNFQVRRLHTMASDAMADHVRDQYCCPDHLLGRPLHLPDADHPSRTTRVSTEQVSRTGTTDCRFCVLILLAGNDYVYFISLHKSEKSFLVLNC